MEPLQRLWKRHAIRLQGECDSDRMDFYKKYSVLGKDTINNYVVHKCIHCQLRRDVKIPAVSEEQDVHTGARTPGLLQFRLSLNSGSI